MQYSTGAFGNVAVIHVRRDKLEGGLQFFSDDVLEFSAAFVIHDMVVDLVAALPEAFHDGVECGDAVLVTVGLEQGLEDGVGVAVVCNHYVLNSTERLDGERFIIV